MHYAPCPMLYVNPEFTVAIYYSLQILAATLASQLFSSTYLLICLRRQLAPTVRFASVYGASLRCLLQNPGYLFFMLLPLHE